MAEAAPRRASMVRHAAGRAQRARQRCCRLPIAGDPRLHGNPSVMTPYSYPRNTPKCHVLQTRTVEFAKANNLGLSWVIARKAEFGRGRPGVLAPQTVLRLGKGRQSSDWRSGSGNELLASACCCTWFSASWVRRTPNVPSVQKVFPRALRREGRLLRRDESPLRSQGRALRREEWLLRQEGRFLQRVGRLLR